VKDCANSVYVYESFAVANYCIPNVKTLRPETKKNWEKAHDAFLNSSAGSYVNDLYLASTAIWVSLGMALIYCFIFMAIMSAFAEVISWLIVALVQLGLIAGAVGCFLLRQSSKETYEKEKSEVVGGTSEEAVAHEEGY
jgi:hypothetical protein